MPVAKLLALIGRDLRGTPRCVGLAFKNGSDGLSESTAIRVGHDLIDAGATPIHQDRQRSRLNNGTFTTVCGERATKYLIK